MKLSLPGLRARGEVSVFITDISTGVSRCVHRRNTLTQWGLNLLRDTGFRWTSGAPPVGSFNYTASIRAIGPNVDKEPLVARYNESVPPYSITLQVVFNPGEATGTITGFTFFRSNLEIANVVLVPSLPKDPNHELIVEWTFYLDFEKRTDSWKIVNGQRDGVTDVNVAMFIPNAYASYYIMRKSVDYKSSQGYRILAGDSNEPSNIVSDPRGIKGASIGEPIPCTSTSGHVLRSDWNAGIGEIVIENQRFAAGYRPICRFTFDPKLDKTDDYELELSWALVSAVEVSPP